MLDLNFWNILIYFALFLALLIAFGPKTFALQPQFRIIARNSFSVRIMNTLTQWVQNDPVS